MNTKLLKELGVSFVSEAGGVREFRLDANGLKVLLVENHSAPVVTTMVVYRVGSRNEAVGYTGSTHFLEHMMFKGTKDRNPADGRGIDDLLKPVGAAYNATTSYDRTNYYEAVPSEHLDLTLAIEADRMRNLVLTKEDRDSEMTVVRNEFERGENSPGGVMYKELMAVAFREHPYHHPVIGWRSDVEGVPMERMKEFYDTFYWPNNATVIIAGETSEDDALSLVVKRFGEIPSSPNPIPEVYTEEPAQEGERRFKVNRIGNDMPQVWMGFHTPAATHDDTYPLAVAAALLGGSGRRTSRLHKALIDSGLAVSAGTWSGENRDPGLFIVNATCAPGVAPEDVEKAILAEIEKLATKPAEDKELWLVKSANRKATTMQRDDSMKFANLLCGGEASADWTWIMNYDDRFDIVTPEQVQRSAAVYFTEKNRTIGYFLPEEAPAEVEKADPKKATFASRVKRHVLDNGLTVIAMATPGTGTASVVGSIRSGECFGDIAKSLVPEMTSYLLPMGSDELSKDDIAERLAEMGADLHFRTQTFETTAASSVVARDLTAYLSVLSSVIRTPKFDEVELDRVRKQFAAFIKQGSSNTERVASARLSQALYERGSAYFEKPSDELLAELPTIGRDDLVAFHAAHYSPKSMVITIVGDIDADKVVDLLPESLVNWQGPDAKEIALGGPAVANVGSECIAVPVPGKASVDIAIGLPAALKRSDEGFFAAQLANAALGRDTLSSRLGLVVREKNGLTYGIYSSFSDTSFGGAPWRITLTVNPENVEKALSLVNEVVADYAANGITEKELEDEKGRAYGEFMVSLRSTMGIARALARYELLGLDASVIDGLKEAYDAVSVEDVNSAIREYFDLSRAVTVIAGSVSK